MVEYLLCYTTREIRPQKTSIRDIRGATSGGDRVKSGYFEMCKKTKAPSKKALIAAYNSGEFLNSIFDRFGSLDTTDLDSVVATCVELHNAGQIDLLSLVKSSELKHIPGFRFFTGQHFFCKAIPGLSASIEEMMRCVQILVEKGGEDLAANQPNAAFRKWCEVDLTRAQEVVEAAKKNDDGLAVEFLTFALTAGNMADQAMGFVAKYTDELQIFGVSALGRMNFTTSAEAGAALATLLDALGDEPDDKLDANILMSAFDILGKTDQITSPDVLEIVKRACQSPGPNTHHSCAHALWLHGKLLSEEILDLLLQVLESVNPANKGTIEEIDHGLKKILETPFASHAIAFVEKLLPSLNSALTLSEFEGFSRELVAGPKDRFHGVLVSWLSSGELLLCAGLSEALISNDRGESPIDLDLNNFDLSPVEQIFLCRKAIGYFFLHPVIAGSILVSVLRTCDESAASDIRDLLFDPLLVNYGGELQGFLNNIGDDDPAHQHIETALKKADKYLENLRSVGGIKELHPSEYERQFEHSRFHDKMSEAFKKAQSESPFLSIVKHSVILYGRKSISFVEEPGGERRPIEIELKSHGTSIELPRIEIVDSIGLDYMLRVFRVERFKS